MGSASQCNGLDCPRPASRPRDPDLQKALQATLNETFDHVIIGFRDNGGLKVIDMDLLLNALGFSSDRPVKFSNMICFWVHWLGGHLYPYFDPQPS